MDAALTVHTPKCQPRLRQHHQRTQPLLPSKCHLYSSFHRPDTCWFRIIQVCSNMAAPWNLRVSQGGDLTMFNSRRRGDGIMIAWMALRLTLSRSSSTSTALKPTRDGSQPHVFNSRRRGDGMMMAWAVLRPTLSRSSATSTALKPSRDGSQLCRTLLAEMLAAVVMRQSTLDTISSFQQAVFVWACYNLSTLYSFI